MENRATSAVLHNGELKTLTHPSSVGEDYTAIKVILDSNTCYSCGVFDNTSGQDTNLQPAYWTDILPTEVPLPEGEVSHAEPVSMAVIDGKIHLVIIDQDYRYYLWEENAYIPPGTAITPIGTGWDSYHTMELYRFGQDIYQAGYAVDGSDIVYFLAQNRIEVINRTTLEPDPIDSKHFTIKGSFMEKEEPCSDSKIYLYGSLRHNETTISAGYTVNEGSWEPLHIEINSYYPPYISFMASTEDYILHLQDEEKETTIVFIDGKEFQLEQPAAESGETVSHLKHLYIEKRGGSVFVAGSYYYSNTDEVNYDATVIWRDGKIVYTGYDENPDGNFRNAKFHTADFE